MSENSYAYFDSVVAHRSLMLNDEEALAGGTTVSLETVGDLAKDDLLDCIQENLAQFLRGLRTLSLNDQELLLSYYLLGKTQMTLGNIYGTTQTVCSGHIRLAMKRWGMLLRDDLESMLPKVLKRIKSEDSLGKVPLSVAILLYDKTRSFQYVSEKYKVHRPDIRRCMRQASKILLESEGDQEQMVGAYIQGLIEKASAQGQGLSKRQLAKQCHLYTKDPDCLGDFRVSMKAAGVDSLFTPRANR